VSSKGSSSAEIISLPQGGGAVKGLGEKFSPDLFTGTGNFSIPLALPPGRNGFQPQMSLVFSTGNGNSPFGLGWSPIPVKLFAQVKESLQPCVARLHRLE
jgi:Salmonella virulence plasmid 65kDa B protein